MKNIKEKMNDLKEEIKKYGFYEGVFIIIVSALCNIWVMLNAMDSGFILLPLVRIVFSLLALIGFLLIILHFIFNLKRGEDDQNV